MRTLAESIIFAVDVDPEVEREAVKGTSRLELVRQCVCFYASCKKKVNASHMFGLASAEEHVRLRGSGLTTSVEELSASCALLRASAEPCKQLDMGSLVALAKSLGAASSWLPPVRVVLIYCRSNAAPSWLTHAGVGVAVDVIYIHEKPQPGVNCVQQVFTDLEEQADAMSRFAGHSSYVFEASSSNSRKIITVMVHLLAHPRQRPPQQELPQPPNLAASPLLPVGGARSGAAMGSSMPAAPSIARPAVAPAPSAGTAPHAVTATCRAAAGSLTTASSSDVSLHLGAPPIFYTTHSPRHQHAGPMGTVSLPPHILAALSVGSSARNGYDEGMVPMVSQSPVRGRTPSAVFVMSTSPNGTVRRMVPGGPNILQGPLPQ